MPRKAPAKRAALASVPDPEKLVDVLADGEPDQDIEPDTGTVETDDLPDWSERDEAGDPMPPDGDGDALDQALQKAEQPDYSAGIDYTADLPDIDLDTLAEQDEYLNGLWWGEEGTRKTTDVLTMANGGRIIVVNAEAGLKKRALARMGVNVNNVLVFPNLQLGQKLTFQTLEALYWKIKGDLEDNPHAYYGVVWDSLTEIHKKLLDNVVLYQVEKADRAGKERERFFIDRNDYGIMTEQMRLLLRRFRDLPCHFAVTALSRRDQDDDGEVKYGPQVTPALQADLLGFMDCIIHTSVVEVGGMDEGQGLTAKGTKFAAKDRNSVLPKIMIDPTFERVLRYAEEEITPDVDPVQQEAKARRAELKAQKEAEKARQTADA